MKPLIIIVLAIAIFGGAAFATWRLYLKPHEDLQVEQQRGPASPPPDPTLPEFTKRVQAQERQSLLEARTSWSEFINQYPESSRVEEAKGFLGKLNGAIFLSNVESPEKQVYIVKSGDVITRVANRLKTTPELLMRSNNLSGSMLRIGQKLVVSPSEFTVNINRRKKKVTLLNSGKYFKQYDILALARPGTAAATPTPKVATPRPPKIVGKVTDRIAWLNGQRITYADKGFAQADYWIVIAPGGHTLFSEQPAAPGAPAPQRPSGGYVMAPEDVREMAALLKKNDQVTID